MPVLEVGSDSSAQTAQAVPVRRLQSHRLYGVNVLNGAAVQNFDGVGDDSNLTKSDRTLSLGSGIPCQAVPIFQAEGVTLLIGGGGGATAVNPNIGLPRFQTYWTEERGS